MAKVVVTGIPDLDRKLAALGAREANRVARQSMRAAMKPMRAAVAANEPVETGHTKRAIKLRAGRRSRGRISLVVALDARDFPEGYYGSFAELGTGHMEGSHAMKRAYDTNRAAVLRDAMARMLVGLEVAARGR